ncbi:YjcQ family protein [Diplocloster agilis]|uniref:YjcQ family protein n=1 Tax=Diplocloster agilis TaxID=2850323 RepID=A0A949NFZ8_9FIRM|nr:YjcQ family protein [Diplocloster agilis]MBU9735798.1 YjcQ family protein [Diplocloster agilis]
MATDIKQQVLQAIYAEYQKELPNMGEITSKKLQIEEQIFLAALMKLQNEKLIQGVFWSPAETMDIRRVRVLNRDNLFLTKEGVQYMENHSV